MRIISRFKESYDYMLGYGIDNKLVYNRETDEIYKDVSPCFSKDRMFSFKILNNRINKMSLKYCDISVNYRLVLLVIGKRVFPMIVSDDKENIFYTFDSFGDFIDEKSNGEYSKKPFYIKYEIEPFTNEELSNFNGAPVSVIDFSGFGGEQRVILNPYLNDYNAYSFMNGFDIFQEISSYLSNQNAEKENNNMQDISDSNKAKGKGFYNYSFKTRPKG